MRRCSASKRSTFVRNLDSVVSETKTYPRFGLYFQRSHKTAQLQNSPRIFCLFVFIFSSILAFRKYENWACDILDQCKECGIGQKKIQDILLRKLPNWGDVSCLKLAESASSSHTFLAQESVEDLVDDIWCNGLSVRWQNSKTNCTPSSVW